MNYNKYGSGPLSKVRENKYYRHSMQLNMSQELFEFHYRYNVKSMHIVQLHPSARSFEVNDIDRMERETRAVLDCRRDSIRAESDLALQLGHLDI